ncbi:hypothetical protein J2Y91_003535 [Erwinia aphidicola]|nr:hypothetical protein [Erwinia aphidicola]
MACIFIFPIVLWPNSAGAGQVRLINAMRAGLSIAVLQYSDKSKVILTNGMNHLVPLYF